MAGTTSGSASPRPSEPLEVRPSYRIVVTGRAPLTLSVSGPPSSTFATSSGGMLRPCRSAIAVPGEPTTYAVACEGSPTPQTLLCTMERDDFSYTVERPIPRG